MRNPHFGVSLDVGYEGTKANYSIYLMVILHIFKTQNFRFLQLNTNFERPLKSCDIIFSIEVLTSCQFCQFNFRSGHLNKRQKSDIGIWLRFCHLSVVFCPLGSESGPCWLNDRRTYFYRVWFKTNAHIQWERKRPYSKNAKGLAYSHSADQRSWKHM